MNAPQQPQERNLMRRLLDEGQTWAGDDKARDQREIKIAWRLVAVLSVVVVVLGVSLATLAPLRRTIPYLVKVGDQPGNIEVLQTFDNRLIGSQELMDLFWATRYVQAREQYNWWQIGADNDFVMRTTDGAILGEYTSLFQGVHAMDKEFGADTDRKIKILSITPAPTLKNTMVVRFERTTISKGMLVEPPTIFVVNMSYRYVPKTMGREIDLIRNPMGYQVYAYRRDPEVGSASAARAPSAPTTAATLTAASASGVSQ